MCGIAGILFPAGTMAGTESGSLVEGMTSVLAHRGPDGRGCWVSGDGRIALGHRRLSILDLSENGRQPMGGSRGSMIVYNGELYNYQDLRRRFDPATLRSTSDTEVLSRCLEADGAKALSYLNGMFAFGFWDPREQTLLLARDRVGIKPLYYTFLGGRFAFASEIRALLTLPWIGRKLDEEALSEFLAFNHLRDPSTMFDGIHKLPPGSGMIVNGAGERRQFRFWAPAAGGIPVAGDRDQPKALRETLSDSVRRQLVSDVPVGVFLSGGVDSSAIVALASRGGEVPVTTYSVGFEGSPKYDELTYARAVATRFRTRHVERVVKREELVQFLPRVVEYYDEPLSDPTSIPVYFISRLARSEGTPVVLTGDGADELFCGYRRWASVARMMPWFRRYGRVPGPLRRLACEMYGWFDRDGARYELLRQAARGNEVYWGAGGFRGHAREQVLSKAYRERVLAKDPYEFVRQARERFREAYPEPGQRTDVNWLCYNGLTDAVPNFYCHRGDRMGMANSIEVRVPFLDNAVVDFALATPSGAKLRDGIPKWILKRAFEAELSRDVLYRRKMGFCVPIREWAGQLFGRYIEDNLEEFCARTGAFDEEALRGQLRRVRDGDGELAFGMWNLYFLMNWVRRWIWNEPSDATGAG